MEGTDKLPYLTLHMYVYIYIYIAKPEWWPAIHEHSSTHHHRNIRNVNLAEISPSSLQPSGVACVLVLVARSSRRSNLSANRAHHLRRHQQPSSTFPPRSLLWMPHVSGPACIIANGTSCGRRYLGETRPNLHETRRRPLHCSEK